ncbi:hypothetical protein SORBI_3003G303500 [Sorghum bicolor]|uniref:Homeobox domain-containing protein n=1 Tax=Sorghum bicolor TaxID=4558 RepID=A0A1W0VZM7_SORBI|nr:hypothetical protein SORBI_3003G303500 [Sorghum bicolor]
MGSSGRPPPRTPPNIFPADLTLSLSLAGPFGRKEPVAALGDEVENGSEGHGGIRGGGLRSGEAMEISSENMGQGSQSGEEASHEDAGGNKRRKSCHKHTPEQIRILEAAFKESPHPDEKQRQQLSEQLGLSASQVKFWFQNRRCQTKVTQERHENSLLMHQENTKLKAEHHAIQVERLHMALENNTATFSTSSSCSMGGIQIRSRNSLDDHVDVGHDDKTMFLELASRALDELTMMCSSGEPLWVRSIETGRDDLNYNEYARLFRHHDDDSGDRRGVWSVEVSRETAVVYGGVTQLVHTFMDVNQWKEMFPSMVTKASTLEVIRAGESDHLDGIMQLMSAEIQTLTPLIPTRELHFLRHCKKLGAQKWAIVDVSLDNFEPGARTSSTLCMCLKKPSGCIVEEQSLARCCKVTWVENVKCRKTAVPAMYRQTVTTSGLAFGARRWVAALQLQCERMVFSVATNVLTWGLNGHEIFRGGAERQVDPPGQQCQPLRVDRRVRAYRRRGPAAGDRWA